MRDPVPMDIQSSAGNNGQDGSMNSNSARYRRPLCFLLSGLFFLFILKNLFFRDYTAETKNYLIGSGASQATIDQFVPPSSVELQKQKYTQLQLFDQLLANMTIVLEEQQQLKKEMHEIKQALGSSSSSPPPAPAPSSSSLITQASSTSSTQPRAARGATAATRQETTTSSSDKKRSRRRRLRA